MSISHGNIRRLVGVDPGNGIRRGGVVPSVPGGGAAVVPSELAELLGYGYYDFAAPAGYVLGSGAGAGRLYGWVDQTPSLHVGTLNHYDGSTAASLPVLTAGSDGFVRCLVGTTERFRKVPPPVSNVMVYVLAFRFPDGAASPLDGFILCARYSTYNRPYFQFRSSPGTWAYQSTGGGSVDQMLDTDVGAKVASVNAYDGQWHCLMIHHSPNANEKLNIDLDGEPLLDTSLISHADFGTGIFISDFWLGSDRDGGYLGLNTLDIGAISIGKNAATQTVANSRALAEAIMAQYGITSLA